LMMINMDDNIVTGKQFPRQEHYSLPIFKPYRSFRKKFIRVPYLPLFWINLE
jgi:hypothetical protein